MPEHLSAKWSAALLEEGFVPFPKKFIRSVHRILTGSEGLEELAVILAVTDYRRPSVTRPPSIDYLSFVTELSPENVQKALQRLKERGLVTVTESPLGVDVDTRGLIERIQEITSDTQQTGDMD